MSPKVTGLLGVLLLLVLGFVFFYERPRMAEEKKNQEDQEAFLDVTRQSVAKFTLVNRFGKFVAEKRGTEWQILEPVHTPGDWGQFESMVTAARAVKRGRVIVDQDAYAETDLSAFGLKPAQVEVRFEDKKGEDIWLFFGDDNPTGRAAYLTWSESNQVVLGQRSDRNRFDLQLMDLRDKRILPFDLDQVTQIVLKHSGQTYEMVRNGFRWQILHPEPQDGDPAEINNILGSVRSERIVEVVAEDIENPTQYGFDAPGYALELTYKDGKKRTLVLGKEVEDQRLRLWYAKTSERPYVFLVEPFMTDFLRIDMGDIRQKRVFEFDRTGISRIQLAYPDSIVSCESKNGVWTVTQPKEQTVDGSIVGAWIDRVHTMAVSGFEGKPNSLRPFGLDRPAVTVSLWRGEDLVQEVSIGQGDRGWYGMKVGSPEVFAFDSGVMSGLRLPMREAPKSGVE